MYTNVLDSNLSHGNIRQFMPSKGYNNAGSINTLANQTHKSGKNITIPSAGGATLRETSIMQQTTFLNSNNNDNLYQCEFDIINQQPRGVKINKVQQFRENLHHPYSRYEASSGNNSMFHKDFGLLKGQSNESTSDITHTKNTNNFISKHHVGGKSSNQFKN